MEDVRKNLAAAWDKLHTVGKTFKLKNGLNSAGLDQFLIELDDIEGLIHEAKRLAASYLNEVAYVICSEVAPGKYDRFTHGPVPEMGQLLNYSDVQDGQILARVKMVDGSAVYQPVLGYLDGEWMEIEE